MVDAILTPVALFSLTHLIEMPKKKRNINLHLFKIKILHILRHYKSIFKVYGLFKIKILHILRHFKSIFKVNGLFKIKILHILRHFKYIFKVYDLF